MLILTRKPGESLYIGDNLKVTIVEIKGNQIRVGIDAPPEYRIYREEIYLQILEENKKAAEAGISGDALEQLSGTWRGSAKPGSGDTKPRSTKRVAITGRPGKQIEARAKVCERCGAAVTGASRICSSCGGEMSVTGGNAAVNESPSNERGKGS
ncbi:MAG: carbon storage regulator CsrA [Pseudomonadota bacterium]